MKLSHMLPITDVIDAGDLPDVAVEASRRWSADNESLTYIRASATAVFRFKQLGEPRILRLHHEGDRNPDLIQAELDFIEQVVDAGVPAARSITSDRGKAIEESSAGDQIYYATAFEELQGERLEAASLTEEHCHRWGGLLGAVHEVSRKFGPPESRHRYTWVQELRHIREESTEIPSRLEEELEAAIDWFGSLRTDPESYGLIHDDVELDNMVWQGTGFALFDFDDCMYNWYAADVASSVEDLWNDQHGARRDALQSAFFEGYRDLSDEIDLGLIPRFHRLAALRRVLRVGRFLEGRRVEDCPEWVATIHGRREATISGLLETEFAW